MGDADDAIVSPSAGDAASADLAAHADATSTLRRSKRDNTLKAEPAKSPSNAQEEAATALQQRRSQRSVKSTYATATVAQKEPAQRESHGKKALPEPVTVVEREAEMPRRTRSTRSATTTADTTPPASPVKTEAPSTPSAAKTPVAPAIAQVVASESGVAPLTPPRNRRPSRRQADVDAGVAPSQRPQTHLILGAYSASDATALCEVIWYHVKENSYKADVLLKDRSPATIDWQRVSERLHGSHEVSLTPRECQRLWKFISYGKDVGTGGGDAGDRELLADSEPEELELTTEQINARVKTSRTEEPVAAVVEDGQQADPEPTVEITGAVEETTAPATAEPQADQPTGDEPRQTLRTNGIQLFPVYNQPEGVPDEWKKPFGLKQTMPLVFVAEKFLKRKAAPSTAPGDAAAVAAASVTLSGEKTQPKPKRKRKSDVGVGEDGEPIEKKPRKKKAPAAKPPVQPSSGTPADGSTSSIAGSVATGKSPVPAASRLAYVPSSTPPPLPTAARTSFDYFKQMYSENPSVARTAIVSVAGATSPSKHSAPLDAAQLEAAFARASQQVRAACEQLAVDDQRRFDREQLRRRLWEKAMASLTNSPAPSPAPSAPGTPAPAAAPVVAASTTSSSIVDGTTSQIVEPPLAS